MLSAYLDEGGRLLALVDPMMDTGLDGLLSKWGIELGHDIVVDPARQLPFLSAANVFVTTYTQHPIVERMQTFMTLFPLARSASPTKPPRACISATALAMTSEQGWGETRMQAKPFQFTRGEDTPGPVSIAVASERAGPIPSRVVAVGDSDFVADVQLSNAGNEDFAMGALHWLVDQPQLIGIGPKSLESIKLSLSGRQMTGIFWLNFAAVPSVFMFLGLGMWLLRRR